MKKEKLIAIVFAILSAVLYALNIPISKILLNDVQPTMMASYLYLGTGLGVGILFLITKNREKEKTEKYVKKDIPYIIGMIVLDIIAPILLMFGLMDVASSNATLINNFEIVCTSIIALAIFKEAISKKMWFAIFLITIASFVLSIEDIGSFKFSWGAIFVLLATLSWGFENNCTKELSNKNVYSVVTFKGIFSGLGSLIVALILKEDFPTFIYIAYSMILGFVSYGLSIFFYIKAQNKIGASKTSAFYSIAPFIGVFLSFIILKEKLTISFFIGLIIMIISTIIIVNDTLKKDEY